MVGTFQATAGFQDSDFLQDTIKVVLRCTLNVISYLSGFRLLPCPTNKSVLKSVHWSTPPGSCSNSLDGTSESETDQSLYFCSCTAEPLVGISQTAAILQEHL